MKYYGIDSVGKIIIERIPTLPAWTSDDEGRLIYVEDVDLMYYGTENASPGWAPWGSSGTSGSSGSSGSSGTSGSSGSSGSSGTSGSSGSNSFFI